MEPAPPRSRARLEAVAAAVPPGSRVADVGSDHGRLPRLLAASGRAAWCVATELGAGPWRRLQAGVGRPPGCGPIETRRGDGLEPLAAEDRIDVLVLSGMGAATMLRMLQRERLDRLGIGRLVLQPQSGWTRLREALPRLGRGVASERLVHDRGRFYSVITALAGAESPPPEAPWSADEWLRVGPHWLRDGEPLAAAYWVRRLRLARRRRDRARGGGIPPADAELALAQRAVEAFARRGLSGDC